MFKEVAILKPGQVPTSTPPQVRAAMLLAMVPAMDLQNEFVIARIHEFRYRGNDNQPFPVHMGVLGHRSGMWGRMLRATAAAVSGGLVASEMGSSVKYARGHEFGKVGTENVAEHTRRYRDRRVRVRAHTRRVAMSARSPIGWAITDRSQAYAKGLGDAAMNEFDRQTGFAKS